MHALPVLPISANCMVSSVTSLFRNRRSRQPSASLPKIASAPAVVEASLSIPTVKITEPAVEEEIMATTTEEIVIPSTISEEFTSEKLLNGTNGEIVKTVVIETEEEEPHCGCSDVIENGLQKIKTVVEDLPPEYKEAARYSGLVTASLAGLFFSLVLFRITQHLFFGESEGFFCSYFQRPFAPLFDALCHPQYPGIIQDFAQETQHLAGEVATGVSHFFGSIFAGFRAFVTIFWALFGGVFQVISDGVHELVENVMENVAFLFKFFCDFANSLLGIFYRMITGTLDQVGIAVQNMGHLLSREAHPSGWF